MKNKDELLKLRVTNLVLKKDLGYSLDEEENKMFSVMTKEEIQLVRKNILKNIRNQILYIDQFEDYLTELKDEEYRKYLGGEGKNLNIELQAEKLAELEGKCNQMVINVATEKADENSLLGPSIHETYGVSAKKS